MIGQATDPTTALPGWLAGGGLSAIMTWLLIRSQKAYDDESKAHRETIVSKDTQIAECEQRYRDMVERNTAKLYDAVGELGRATEAIRRLQNRGKSA